MTKLHKSSTVGSRMRFHKRYIKERAVRAKQLGKLYDGRTGYLYDKDGKFSKEQ